MKLRRLFAALLVFVLVITNSPVVLANSDDTENAPDVEIMPVDSAEEALVTAAADADLTTISAVDTEHMLWSATVDKNADNLLYCAKQDYVRADLPTIETLNSAAIGEFNASGSEWNWFAYKVSVPTAGTYTLGVKVNSSKWSSYAIPLCVNDEVYTLSYTAKNQQQTVEAPLPAGEHVVVMFMPMPKDAADVENNVWNDYPWCNVESMAVDSALTVTAAPTVAEVEACFTVKTDTVISAPDTKYMLWSAGVKATGTYLERVSNDYRQNIIDDAPYIDSLSDDAAGEFNKSGEEWTWMAYKISVPADGKYTLGMSVTNSGQTSYKIPLYVNNEVHTLSYSAKNQDQTTEVTLPVGEHTVVMFMPMPQNAESATGTGWIDYTWICTDSMIVDYSLSVVAAPTVAEVEACFAPKSDTVISATDTGYMLWSATVGAKEEPVGTNVLYCANSNHMRWDKPTIETLYTDAVGQFNVSGGEWNWFAYNVEAATAGTYTLGVKVNNVNLTGHTNIPLCVNGEVYTLKYTQAPQQVTVDVTLAAGKNTVVMFMPMPEKRTSDVTNNGTYYPWCNVESMIVDRALTVSKPTVEEVEACFIPEDTVISAVDTTNLLLSATIAKNAAALGRTDQATLKVDAPAIETLYSDAVGQFNKSGEEWNWFAYKVTAPAAGTYTLGVKTAGSKYASYQIPMCVNNEVYALSYTAKSQAVTTEVTLPAGEHTVVIFMPLPVNKAAITNNEWNDYHWCDVESVTVDGELTVSKPTVAEVEAVFAPKTLSATDTSYMLWSAAMKHTEGAAFIERADGNGIIADKPYIDSIYSDAAGEFNTSGSEWPWYAYKLSVPAAGTYTLGVKTQSCKNATYAMALCVDGEVYTLNYTAKGQQVTTQVSLTAGEHVVVMFLPMPANGPSSTGNVWNDYVWCNVESMIVGAGLTVAKPTVAEVEACFSTDVAKNPLKGQSVLFVGDSITYSANSWASKIGTWNNMDWTNAGVSGATISDLRGKIIRHALMMNAGNDYDYVIMHGGINDGDAAVGTVSDSWNVADFDTSTYAGGLETMFYYAYENFGSAKLGYIVNYATPNSDPTKWTGTQDMSAYFAVGKQVCEKWGISYIDLYFGSTADGKSYSYDILQVDKAAENFINNDPHEIHLSDTGYKLITPYIEAWMKTLTVKASPIPAANSGKFVGATDESKVLYNNFTPKNEYVQESGSWIVNTGLEDRVYDGMASDSANIEYLPYAKDMMGNWAFASIAVNAEKAGDYKIRVEMGAKNAATMGMLVDGEVYTLNYSKVDGYYEYMEQTVSLTEGTHFITFTAAMPADDNGLTGTAWNDYVWTNIASIVVDEGLEVLAAPALEDVTGKLSPYEPFYNRVEAEDAEYVIYNNYNTPNESNANASGGMLVGGAWNSIYEQTFEELEVWLDSKHNAYVEYAVVAPADGEYEIRVAFLAGTNDKSVAKPYIAVVVNDTTYKAQFSKDWNQIDKVKLTVTLKEGLNIIRCTSITTDQEVYGVRGWVNQDFIDLDKRLTAVKHSSVTVEAENAMYYNKFTVNAGGETENASGKVLGGSDRKYVSGLWLTLDMFEAWRLRQVPYLSITVTAPQDGYYPITLNMSGDGRLPKSTIGMLIDGEVNIVDYVRTDKTTAGAKVYALPYLTAGDHVITFTIPMPASASVDTNYSYLWANFDYVTLYDGLVLAETQKSPTGEPKYKRLEAEDHAMFNLNKNSGTAIGNAYYKSSQSVDEMIRDGIDGTRTPYAEFTIRAKKAGTYVVYVGVSAGMTAACSRDSIIARFAVDVNGNVSAKSILATKSTNWTIIPVWLDLQEGDNTVRMSHLGSDSQCGGTTWIDFDYFEMPYWVSSQLEFVAGGETLEAEQNKYSGYSEYASSSYSGGVYLGDADYYEVDESDITFEKLDPANLGELPHVTYRVYAEKAGTYAVTVGFAAGLHLYTSEEIAAGDTGGFAVVVNGESKQLIEYELASTNSKMSRLVTVELQEGENEITFTTTLAEYIIDHVPFVDETARKIWLDHDFLLLSGGLTGMSNAVEVYDIEDSDYDHAQLTPRAPSDNSGEDDVTPPVDDDTDNNTDGSTVPAIVWILAGAGVAFILILILLLKKRKKDDGEE